MTPLDKSPFSRHFYYLTLIGAWFFKDLSKTKWNLYVVYKTFMTFFGWYAAYLLILDFFLVFGDFKKMTWNLCISTLFTGSLVKNLVMLLMNNIIDKLRLNLHRDAESRTSPHYIPLHDLALKKLKVLEISFYGVGTVSVATWISTQYLSYLWGPREFPIPLRIPIKINMEDDFEYNFNFIIIGALAMVGLFMVVEQELAMFTLLIQLAREYEVFLLDIQQLNEVDFKETEDTVQNPNYEINPYLKELKVKLLLKKFSIRQQKLIWYVEQFEICYNFTLMLQFVVTTLLIVVSLIQCIIESGNFSVKISYQLGYSATLLSDMFLICWYSTKLNTYCFKVGEAVYSSKWYSVSPQTQKDFRMMMMRAQNPPKITGGKMIVLNLHAFTILVRNVYSWLALFMQLEIKI